MDVWRREPEWLEECEERSADGDMGFVCATGVQCSLCIGCRKDACPLMRI